MARERGTADEVALLRRLDSEPAAWAAAVAAATGRPGAALTDVRVTRLSGGAGNPTSAGLFRITGTIGAEGPHARLSLVLKQVRSPQGDGNPMDSPSDALYWRRELEAYRSGLLDDLPARIVAPRSYGTVEFPDATGWLWLEDMGSVGRSPWTAAEHHLAAAHLARFHAAYLMGVEVPEYPWLNRDFARGWLAITMPVIRPVLDRAVGGDGAYTSLDPARDGRIAPLVRLLLDPERWLATLESMPQVLCHLDANPDNLLLRRTADGGTELVAIDWQLVGFGPVGEDIAQLLCGVVAAEPAREVDLVESVLARYWAELTGAGVRIPLRDVRRGYYVAAALRQVSFAFMLLGLEIAALGAGAERTVAEEVEAFAERIANGPLPRLVVEALVLLDERE